MKKAIQVNISDKIFFIDEDAYYMLQNYLHQLSITFQGDEGAEILADIEARIAELFSDYTSRGVKVVDIRYVNEVIDTVGRPEQLDETPTTSPAPSATSTPPPFPEAEEKTSKHLYRDVNNKVFGGVLSGLAVYMDWDATILRLLVVVLALCTAVMPCVVVYLLAWMVIKPANTPRRRLEMLGREVNVSTVSSTILDNSSSSGFNSETDASGDTFSHTSGVLGICSKILMAIVGTIGIIAGGGLTIALLVMMFVLIMFCCVGESGVGEMCSVGFSMSPVGPAIWFTLVFLIALMVIVAIVWMAGAVVFDWHRPSPTVMMISAGVFLVLIAAVIVIGFYLTSNGIFNRSLIEYY